MFSTAQPMPGFGRVFALIGAGAITLSAISFTAGVMVERSLWERSDMGDLCDKGHYWACYLHPDCEMHSLFCFDNLQKLRENRTDG